MTGGEALRAMALSMSDSQLRDKLRHWKRLRRKSIPVSFNASNWHIWRKDAILVLQGVLDERVKQQRAIVLTPRLTKQELSALAWSVTRAAQNSCILLGAARAEYAGNKKAYDAKVKLARAALAKVKQKATS